MSPRLVEPSSELLEPFLRLAHEVREAEADFASIAAVRREDWEHYVTRLAGMRSGLVPTMALVPLSTYWLLDDDGELVGVSGLRHRLTPALRDYGGHLGFALRPSARGRGLAAVLLGQTLARASERGLGRALLTCDADNVASRRTIERCGGVLDAEYRSPRSVSLLRRFWLELGGDAEELRA